MRHDLDRFRQSLLHAMGVAPALAGLALAGCDVDDSDFVQAQAAGQDRLAAPTPNLAATTALTGVTTQWQVTNATPGAPVRLLLGSRLGAGRCPPPLRGACLDITPAILVGSGRADASGAALLDVMLPSAIPDGAAIHLQVVQLGATPSVGNVVDAFAVQPKRVCGPLPEPTPRNYTSTSQFLLCMPLPATGVCETGANVPYADLEQSFLRHAGLASQPVFGGFSVYANCDETAVEDRCCYGADVYQIAIGRPFTVQGSARLAGVSSDAAWRSVGSLDLTDLPDAVRERLAALWTTVARGEHASVASFARFQLQLLGLGAPADLVADTTRAMADEVRHAQDAFAVASTLAGHPVGAGPLDVQGALDTSDVVSIVRAAFREGCIAETIAAAQVAEAARRCTTPSLAATLVTVGDDETRHAALAWRFVRWMVARHPELRDVVEEEIAQPYRIGRAQIDPDTAWLERFGQLALADADALAQKVFERVVVPCARAMLDADHTPDA